MARVEVREPGVKTETGIQIGDTEAATLQTYGKRLEVSAHYYEGPEEHYLTARSADGHYGIRFETEKRKIAMFYAGTYEAIQFVEGCL